MYFRLCVPNQVHLEIINLTLAQWLKRQDNNTNKASTTPNNKKATQSLLHWPIFIYKQ